MIPWSEVIHNKSGQKINVWKLQRLEMIELLGLKYYSGRGGGISGVFSPIFDTMMLTLVKLVPLENCGSNFKYSSQKANHQAHTSMNHEIFSLFYKPMNILHLHSLLSVINRITIAIKNKIDGVV